MPVALLAPPKSRSRASSTGLKPSSICKAIGRRRSNSCLRANEPALAPAQPDPPPTMLAWFVSRSVQWLHLSEKQAFAWSAPSSPRSSTDEFILPLSASATTVSFSVPEPVKPSAGWQFSLHAPIVFVVLLFPISTALVLWCLSTLPISLAWPHDITDLAQLGRELHAYTQSGLGPLSHVVGVMAISAVWKHAWSIPGSVLWVRLLRFILQPKITNRLVQNVLGGALFSPLYATVLLTTLTTVGSICASLLSAPLGPFLAKIFPKALDMTRSALGGESDADSANSGGRPKSPAWVRLSVLRLIGVVPWSGINIACGVCGVSLVDCSLGTFIGCLPWTAVTCQVSLYCV